MRVMLDLALADGPGPVRVKEIAERQQLSPKYIEHLISTLKTAGLLRSRRGMHGGYTLAKPPAKIKLLEIFTLLEGSTRLAGCLEEPGSCPRERRCATRTVWAEIADAMTGVLESTTLEDLADRQRNMERTTSTMYHI
jgi:Rrf2 family protein